MRCKTLYGLSLLTFSVALSRADDTELFVANLPSDAQANVLFIMDNSGSMSASTGSGSRMEVAKAAARNFVQNAENVNISLMSFAGPQGGKVDFASEDIVTGRTGAINVINGYGPDIPHTPLSETLYEAYRYFAGLSPRYGGGGTPSARSGANYISPIVNACQKSNIVLFTDGAPYDDGDAAGDIRNLVNGLTLPAGLSGSCIGNGNCMDELSWYMFNQDLRSLSGDQNVTTYTIGGFGSAPPGLLTSTANHGGGQYYSATNANQLNEALADILLRVNAEDSTFASPATSVSAFNTLETAEDVYYIMFKPNVGPGWTGNLKRYRLGDDNQIYDANGDLAIDPLTGFFTETAQSFWSSAPDGKTVGVGGMVEQITQSRNLYTNISGDSNVQLNAVGNALHESNAGVTAQLLGQTIVYTGLGLAQFVIDEREDILQWARGIDVDDSDSDGDTTDTRHSIGDPIHTQPQVITYFKDSTGSVVDKTVYFTTNDGFIHAINADDGSTEFGYIPRDLLPNLKIYRDGYTSGGIQKAYGLDGPMSVWINDANNDGDLLQSDNGPADIGDHAYLYLTMRRGGNNIYALDVTNRSNPTLKWVIRGDLDNNHQADSSSANPDFYELGQTWSAPRLARVQWNGSERMVLFFGGGYDLDADGQSTIGHNDIGRAVYMVDAETGSLLWRAGQSGANLNISLMNYSIAAGLTLIDIDQDGNTDYLFAADIGGQLFRFDINQINSGAGNFASGGVIANISGTNANNARRFFEAPDVVVGKDSQYLNIAIGSGFRPHPLNTDVNDRIYVFRDPNVYDTPTSYLYANSGSTVITESDLYDATSNLVQTGSASQQQAALTSLQNNHGWLMQLQTSGEKVLGKARVFNGVLLFNSFAPRTSSTFSCGPQPGENYFYAVNIENASSVFNLDTIGSLSNLGTDDRRQLLKHGTLAPTPSIVTRNDQGAEICVGTECFQNILQSIGSVPMNRNFWRENQ